MPLLTRYEQPLQPKDREAKVALLLAPLPMMKPLLLVEGLEVRLVVIREVQLLAT